MSLTAESIQQNLISLFNFLRELSALSSNTDSFR